MREATNSPMIPMNELQQWTTWHMIQKVQKQHIHLRSSQQLSNCNLQQEENSALYWKPSQLLRASELIFLEGEPPTTTSLSQHSPSLHSKHLSLYPQVSIVLSPHQGNFPLRQMETITDSHTNENVELGSLVSMDTSKEKLWHPSLRELGRRWARKTIRAKGSYREIVSSRDVRIYKGSPTWLPKH